MNKSTTLAIAVTAIGCAQALAVEVNTKSENYKKVYDAAYRETYEKTLAEERAKLRAASDAKQSALADSAPQALAASGRPVPTETSNAGQGGGALAIESESKSGFFIGAGGEYAWLSTDAVGQSIDLNLAGGMVELGYSAGNNNFGIKGGYLSGDKQINWVETVRVTYCPVKLFYHYNFNICNELSFFAGPSAGAVYTKVEDTYSAYGYSMSGYDAQVSPTASIDLGFKLKPLKSLDLMLGYEFVWVQNTTYGTDIGTGTHDIDAKNILAHQVSLKASYRF